MLASGEKPEAQWRIGTEHEQFGFRLDDLRPPTFDGERGIEASVTLEPAGQLELSGAPLHTIHDTCVEVGSHLNEVKQVTDQLGLGFRHGLPAEMEPRGDAVDAQGPLQDHAGVHA